MTEKKKSEKEYIKTLATINSDLSILEFFLYVMRKRLLIFFVSIVLLLLLVAAYFYEYSKQPFFHSSRLGFTLNFDGLDQHKYPNGSPFLQEDIISNTILYQVYKENELNVFFNDFENFKKTISIFRNAMLLELNRLKYTSKLSNSELKTSERTEIEQEYYSKRDELLSKTSFSLVCSYTNSKYFVPDIVISKALNDILSIWLDITKRQKGTFKYNVPLLTSKLIQKDLEKMDYFISMDFLRRIILKIQDSVSDLKNLPNCNQITVTVDNKDYTLEDISFELDYILNYELLPLMEKVKLSGVCKKSSNIKIYLNNMLYSIKEKINLINSERNFFTKMYEENIADEPKHIVDKSLEIFRLINEEQFYNKINNSFAFSDDKANDETELLEDFDNKQNKLKKNILYNNLLANKFYEKISKYNLDPNSKYYNIVSFSSYSKHLLNKKILFIKLAAVFLVFEVLILLALYIKFILYKKCDD